ncbi:hypothetical protein BH10BAC2_BH10BAC2_41550 [soil metagenome]
MVYQFGVGENNRFIYLVTQTTNNDNIISYYCYGYLKKINDSIYLSFDNRNAPKNTCTYLIKEASGSYLIQNLTDSSKRIFMKIYRCRHFGNMYGI